MKPLLFGLLVFGLLLTVVGWFFDRIDHFPWLAQIVSSENSAAISALDILSENNRRALTKRHPGFKILLESWPNFDEKDSVKFIGRSVPYMEFGSIVSNDFELLAYNGANENVGKPWSESKARRLFSLRFDRAKFWIGTVVFYFGVLISLIAAIIELRKDNCEGQK